ncbi:MAG: hypothetical protein WAP52_02165 [Candidatus Sungiibacteriota bacterium]
MYGKSVIYRSGTAITMIASCAFLAYFFFLNPYTAYGGVRHFGPLRLGSNLPSGGAGDFTFAPLYEIPSSKFYVTIVQPDMWCSGEDCDLDGALIQTMGGWLQMEKPSVDPEIEGEVGLNRKENKNIHSLVLIGDQNNKIAGIYPNRGLSDVLPILRLHTDLADFSLLAGVQEVGALKVGQPAPLQPGNTLKRFGDKPEQYSITHVPTGKKFYLFSVQKRKYDMVGGNGPHKGEKPRENEYACYLSGCRYPEPDPPHDFLFAYIEDLGGWFFSNDQDNSALPPLFGLSQKEVLAGDASLVILADAKGIIRALHPGKTLSDALTILSQHPDLADVAGLYRPHKK